MNQGPYQYPIPIHRKDWVMTDQIIGKPLLKFWIPVKIRIIKNDPTTKNMTAGDFPYFSAHVPLFSWHAVSVLRDILEPHGEFLPLDCKEQKFIAFNVFTFLDVLDIHRSEITYFEDGKRIMAIDKYSFLPFNWKDVVIFKLPQESKGYVFVTDTFVNRVKEAKLKGFDFEKVWEG